MPNLNLFCKALIINMLHIFKSEVNIHFGKKLSFLEKILKIKLKIIFKKNLFFIFNSTFLFLNMLKNS